MSREDQLLDMLVNLVDQRLAGEVGVKTVAKSSSEAEYVALASATQEVIWLRRLFADLGLKLTDIPTVIFEDTQAAIELSKNPRHHNRMKHVDINYHFTRERESCHKRSISSLCSVNRKYCRYYD